MAVAAHEAADVRTRAQAECTLQEGGSWVKDWSMAGSVSASQPVQTAAPERGLSAGVPWWSMTVPGALVESAPVSGRPPPRRVACLMVSRQHQQVVLMVAPVLMRAVVESTCLEGDVIVDVANDPSKGMQEVQWVQRVSVEE